MWALCIHACQKVLSHVPACLAARRRETANSCIRCCQASILSGEGDNQSIVDNMQPSRLQLRWGSHVCGVGMLPCAKRVWRVPECLLRKCFAWRACHTAYVHVYVCMHGSVSAMGVCVCWGYQLGSLSFSLRPRVFSAVPATAHPILSCHVHIECRVFLAVHTSLLSPPPLTWCGKQVSSRKSVWKEQKELLGSC